MSFCISSLPWPLCRRIFAFHLLLSLVGIGAASAQNPGGCDGIIDQANSSWTLVGNLLTYNITHIRTSSTPGAYYIDWMDGTNSPVNYMPPEL